MLLDLKVGLLLELSNYLTVRKFSSLKLVLISFAGVVKLGHLHIQGLQLLED